MKYSYLMGALAALLFIASSAIAQKREAGQLLNASGDITLSRDDTVVTDHARTLTTVRDGDVLILAKSAKTDLLLHDGPYYALMPGSKVKIDAGHVVRMLGDAPRSLPSPGKNLAGLSPENSKVLSGRIGGVGLRGSDMALHRVKPVGAVTTPVIAEWTGDTVGDLEVRVVDLVSKEVYLKTLKRGSRKFEIPANFSKPGIWYEWSVSGMANDGMSLCGDRFRISTKEDGMALKMLEKQARNMHRLSPKDPAPYILLALAYEQIGDFDNAYLNYEEALKLKPGETSLKEAHDRVAP